MKPALWWNDLLALFFPELCLACDRPLVRGEEWLCLSCLSQLPLTGFHEHRDNPVARLLQGRIIHEGATSCLYFSKGGKVQHLIHHLKYKGNQQVGHWLGEMMGRMIAHYEPYNTIDTIVPVPLHKKRQRQRGYNQSALLAGGMASVMGCSCSIGNLIRHQPTQSQTHRSRYQRLENVKGSFSLLRPQELAGKHVLLVDDVLTTGATLEASADVLSKVEGIRITVATLAYALE